MTNRTVGRAGRGEPAGTGAMGAGAGRPAPGRAVAENPLAALAARNLIIVAGKGGVGKTTCSSAIALDLARAGRKTLLVTVDPAKRLADSLGMPVGHTATPVQPGLAAMMLDPAAVIKEHLEREIPDAKITEHPLFRYVSTYLPGLNELMAIGKLNDLRREGAYDCIVVDTAPTGHALSFLWFPRTIKELLSDKSVVRWALRGYAVWQRLSGAARSVQTMFKKDDKDKAPPDIDFERVFADMESEATRIQAFLSDPDHSALVLVTIPERLPVEETCELYAKVRGELGMNVTHVVVNKVQPDPFAGAGVREAFLDVIGDGARRRRFVGDAAAGAGVDAAFVAALVDAAEFNDVRRQMNLDYVGDLRRRLPEVPLLAVPLFKQDVSGVRSLTAFIDAVKAAPTGQHDRPTGDEATKAGHGAGLASANVPADAGTAD